MYQKRTIRIMPPTTRKLALLLNEHEKTGKKLKKLLPIIERNERTEQAMMNKSHSIKNGPVKPTGDFVQDGILDKATKEITF